MREMRGRIKTMLFAFIVMFVFLSVYFTYSMFVNGRRYFSSAYNPRLTAQRNQVEMGDILERNYTALASSDADGNRVYQAPVTMTRALCHTIGDPYGIAASGAETQFSQYLLGFAGNVFERLYQELSFNKPQGDSVVLTVDGTLSSYALEKLGSNNGAVVVLNYKTGEVLCSVSSPGYDLKTIKQQGENAKDGIYVNRVTQGKYTPGSIFKIVTIAAVQQHKPELLDQTFTCTGKVEYEAGNITCAGNAVHGDQTLDKALSNSCNCVFAQLAGLIGGKNLRITAEKFGFNTDFLFTDLAMGSSSFVEAKKEEPLNLAWSAAGQYKDVVSPMHVAMITASVANDGIMMEPKLLKSIINARNFEHNKLFSRRYTKPMSAKEALQLREWMIKTVEGGTASGAKIKGYQVGGKTGTAQVTEGDSKKPHAWYTGFIYDDAHPLVVTVLVENVGSGSKNAVPVATNVLKKALELGY